MNKIAVLGKINNLEVKIKLLKFAVATRPDFDIDEKNWKKLRPTVKKVRSELFRKTYSSLAKR